MYDKAEANIKPSPIDQTLIIDEASMLDITLMQKLVRSLDKNSKQKSLFMAICYGVIRHYWELQADLNRYISRPIKKKDSVIENLIDELETL